LELNFRKEQFSVAFVRALAAVAGLSVSRPEPDCDSEDLILSARLHGTPIRSPKVALQLKCSSNLGRGPDSVSIALPLKNYDDLRPTNLAVPRLLVVVEIPPGEEPNEWIHQTEERVCLLRSAYWLSLYDFRSVANNTSVTVHLPLQQRLTPSSLLSIMVQLGKGLRL
jgi:hypothetical protein